MKNITILIFAALIVGCNSQPKQTQPTGKPMAVYPLQNELNERPHWRDHSKAKTQGTTAPKGATNQPVVEGRGNE